MIEYARLASNVPAGVLRDAQEARAAAVRLGVGCVQRDGVTGTGQWRAVCRTAAERAEHLAKIEAEVGLTPAAAQAARRRAHLRDIEIDLMVDRLRARRRAQRSPARAGRAVWP